jgi:hypothetical protein
LSSRKACLILIGLMVVPILAAAQRATEWQMHGLANVGGDRFVGGGVGLALRTNGRMRVGMVLNAGDLEGSAAVRPELLGSYHLNPYKRQGISPYAGGGVAAVFADGTTREYIVAFLGVESRPGRSIGWFAEAGIGGGARLVAGLQYRKRRTRAR